MNTFAVRAASGARAAILLGICALGACSTAPRKEAPVSTPPPAPSVPDPVAASESAWNELLALDAAQRSDEARALVLKQIQAPDFLKLPGRERHRWLQRAGRMSIGDEAYEEAYAIFRYTSQMPEADPEDWGFRFFCAQRLRAEADAVFALDHIVRTWPTLLKGLDARMVSRTAMRPAASAEGETDRFHLLEALYAAGWKLKYGFEPSDAWADLARMLLERQQTERAIAVAAHVTAPRTLLALRVDKRFDALVQANPDRFDVGAAVAREIGVLEKLAAESPRLLALRYELLFALGDAGQFQRALKMADEVLAGQPGAPFESLYDDSAEYANWIFDARAQALLGLGKWPEAQRYFEQAAARLEKGQPNVSNAINLASLHARFGRSRQALDALGPMVLDDKGVSGYGGMQVQHVLLLASLASHDKVATQSALDFMRENQLDALSTFQSALLSANALDEAASLLVRRLKDPALRADALAEVQDYRLPPMTPADRTVRQRRQVLMARNDVKAAVAEVGRLEQFSIPPP